MSFSFGDLFGGLKTGVTKGLQYDATFMRSFVWALEHANTSALSELSAIAKQNAAEMVDEAGNLLPNVLGALIAGGDPFSTSRHMMQAWTTKYGTH